MEQLQSDMNQSQFDPRRSPNSLRLSPTVKRTLIVFSVLVVVLGGALGLFLYDLSQDLPDTSQFERYRPELGSKVYSADGKLIKEFFEKRRTFTPLTNIPDHVVQALLATEDRRFYNHWGVNLMRLFQALAVDLIHLEKRQGASTISQQLSRQLYWTTRKTWRRKIQELLTAIQIERTYTKDEIIEMYLNHVYFGHGAHGVQMAAQYYFGKDVSELDIREGAMLIAVVQRPEQLSPHRNPQICLARRNLVLYNMKTVGYLSTDLFEQERSKELGVLSGAANLHYGTAPYFTEHVRQLLWKKYGRDILTTGWRIYTTLDTRVQQAAEQATATQLAHVQRLVNNRLIRNKDHLKLITPEELDSLGVSMRELVADTAMIQSLLSHMYPVQAALVCLDTKTGYVKALIGGRDFDESKYNRAIQAKRQPGSAFKPFVYTTVIDNGYPPTFEIINQPVVVNQPDGTEWRPHNYDGSIGGFVTLREALTRSLNLPTVRLVQQITRAEHVINYARKMGITTNLLPFDAIAALGAGEVIPIELTSAYSAIANRGVLMEPLFITRIEDKDGNVIEDNHPYGREVLGRETAYIMTSLMGSVMDSPRGTGYAARSRYGFTMPAGGKSGTTNDYRDAWFLGYTPHLTTGVWVGFDQQNMSFERGTGSSIALPIWAPFMKAAHEQLQLQPEAFVQPEGVVTMQVCAASKQLANDECPAIINEIFKAGSEPRLTCQTHRGDGLPKSRRRDSRRSRS